MGCRHMGHRRGHIPPWLGALLILTKTSTHDIAGLAAFLEGLTNISAWALSIHGRPFFESMKHVRIYSMSYYAEKKGLFFTAIKLHVTTI